jgi:undecaprenyl-diphosphatase
MYLPLLVLLCGSAPLPTDAPKPGMGALSAACLGLIEGISEYLPVSSTGHLILGQRALGIPTDTPEDKAAADAFAICIQAGAILAVLGLYRRRASQIGLGLVGKNPDGLKLGTHLIVAFIPAAIIGLTAGSWIKATLFGMWPIVAAWFVGGVVILVFESRRKTNDPSEKPAGQDIGDLTWRLALIIGLLQCVAMWPGVSRSLVTILAGVAVGLSLAAAVEFSFLLGVVTLGAATAYDTLQHGPLMLEKYGAAPLVIGTLVAAVAAAISVKWLVGYLNRRGLAIFGYYRIGLAVVVGALLLMGVLA